jgi:O-antigen ligase
MRLGRLGFILLGIYLVFLGGSAYYNLIFPVRLFHHALVTLLLAGWLVARIRRGVGLPQTPLNAPLYMAVIVWFITAAASLDPRMAFEHVWFLVIHVLSFLALADLFAQRRERLVLETQFMLAAVVVLISGLELASWYFGLGIIPGTGVGWAQVIGPGVWLPLKPPRLALAMNISTLLAGYVAPLVTLAAAWALTTRRRDYRMVLWALTGALALVLVLTFSRGGLLSLLTAAAFLLIPRLAQSERLKQMTPSRLFIGGAAIGGMILIAGFVVLSISGSGSRAGGDVGRLDMWRSAGQITRDRTLTGVGPGLFGRAFRDYRDPTVVQDKLASAHNIYLNTAAETGLLGIGVSIWLAITFILGWRRNRQSETWPGRKLRLEAAFAALLGVGVHSLVDVFTVTPIVLLIALLAAYCIIPNPAGVVARLKPAPTMLTRWEAMIALLIVLAYGIWFFQIDRAQIHYQRSLRADASALDEAHAAADLDPALKLYQLNITFLLGEQSAQQPDTDVGQAIAAYENALQLEPTWDTGWINLAALRKRQGDEAGALADLNRARQINFANPAPRLWAELAEKLSATSKDDITAAYYTAIRYNFLPLSAYWNANPMRRAALDRYLPDLPLDHQYRVLAVHDLERAKRLVPAQPQTAAEWWVLGEHALGIKSDPQAAANAFSQAIALERTNGDYYASRARAELRLDPAAAARDLKLADLLGAYAEYPNAIRASLATTPQAIERLRTDAVPVRTSPQEFAAVLFGRPAVFDVFPDQRPIGLGRAAMQPWYAIAAERLAAGRTADARNVYRAILEQAPDEQEARAMLAKLTP